MRLRVTFDCDVLDYLSNPELTTLANHPFVQNIKFEPMASPHKAATAASPTKKSNGKDFPKEYKKDTLGALMVSHAVKNAEMTKEDLRKLAMKKGFSETSIGSMMTELIARKVVKRLGPGHYQSLVHGTH